MRNSLFFRLMGAFLLVITLGALITAIFIRQVVEGQFRNYTNRSGQAWAQTMVPPLVGYYAEKGSWQGVDTFFATSLAPTGFMTGMMPGMMSGMHSTPGLSDQSTHSSNMWSMMGQRLLLSDADGKVIIDSQGEWLGRKLSGEILSQGESIIVASHSVGTLIVGATNEISTTSVAGNFLSSLDRSLFIAVLLSALVAIGVGSVLFFQLTAPIHRLTLAARTIATGKLDLRVPIRAKDEIGELSTSFNEMAESLRRAENQRRQILADVAHELRNPLSIVQGSLEAIMDGVVPLEMEQITSLHGETILLNRLVDDLRFLSIVEAGQLHLERHPIALREMMASVVEYWQLPVLEHGLSITFGASDDLPLVDIDPDRITQVINNLVANALRYTPRGGRIEIRAEQEPGNPGIRVSVTDTGLGIGSEDLPNIFDRFYRAERSQSKVNAGSGLGLAIVKHLVEAHSGTVHAESPIFQEPGKPGYGTCIWFTIPAQETSGIE